MDTLIVLFALGAVVWVMHQLRGRAASPLAAPERA